MKFENIGIGKRMAMGFGVVLTLLVGVGASALHLGNTGSSSVEQMTILSNNLDRAGKLAQDAVTLRVLANRFVIEGKQDQVGRFNEKLTETNKGIDELRESLTEADELQKLEEVSAHLKAYAQIFAEMSATRLEADRVYAEQMGAVGGRLSDSVDQLANDAAKGADSGLARRLFELLGDLNGTRMSMLRYLRTLEKADFDNAERYSGQTKAVLTSLLGEIADREKRGEIEQLAKEFEGYASASAVVYTKQEQVQAKRAEMDTVGPKVSTALDELGELFTDEAKEVESAATSAIGVAQSVSVGLSGAALLLGVGASLLIARSVVRPVRQVTDALKDIAQGEGDLTRRLNLTRKDELGELAGYFDSFVDKIHNVVREVASASRSVSAASTEIAASAEEMAQGLAKQEEQSGQVSSAVEQLSATVSDVANKSAQAAQAASASKTEALQGGEVVQNTVNEIAGIADEVKSSSRSVSSLGEKSEQIGRIIGVINDIADQTNLLALNAAIEAARAGEHGRGFAVVADEVRKLAERTTKATEEVGASIRDIQSGTGDAIKMIESSSQRVTKGVDLAGAAGEALKKIQHGSEQVGSMIGSIASATTEQSAATEQIARNIERINAVTKESAQGAQQAAQAASSLSENAEKLHKLVGRFKV